MVTKNAKAIILIVGRALIKSLIDLAKINMEEWVTKTEGMSLSHLKEVVISTIVMGRSFEETLENLEGMKKTPSAKPKSDIGFGK